MSKIFRAAAPLTSRIAPVLGAVLVLVGLIASSQLHLAQVTAGSTVTTDKNDYAPGETVAISGSGWIPGQPVALHIDESDSDLPWDSSATPDAAGNISNSDFVIQTNDIGVLFTLTATQGSVTATTQFTDVVAAGTAPNGDPGGFEIEGNVAAAAGGGHTDWVANGVGTTGLLNSVTGDPLDSTVTFRRLDAYSGTDDVFASSHKFGDNPNTYTWKTASAASKDDLNNVYVHISKDAAGDRWITASADRLSHNGTAFVDFELTQADLSQVTDVGCSSAPCGHFVTNPAGAVSGDPLFATGGRTPNDLLITAQYNSGGSLATAIVYQWKLVSGTYQWVDITSSIAVNTAFVATNTVDGVSVPYGAFGATTQTVLTDGGSTTFTGLSAGTKTVHVVATGGCTKDVTIDVTQPASAVGSSITSQTNVGCFGGSTGSVTVAGSGGTPSYTYSIDGTNFGVSGTFNNLAAGSYTVTVKDANGCTTTQPVTITQTASTVSASISSQTNVACFGGSTGSVTVSASGGTSPYTFSKDGVTFGASGTFGNLAAGSYTITVKDANGCTTTQGVTITQPAAALGASISSQTNVACFGNSMGSVTVAGSGGTAPYSFSKDGVNFGASGTFGSLAAGSYTITVKDANGCATTQPVTITQPASALGSSISSQTNVACFGGSTGSVTVAGSGGTSPYTFSKDGVNFGASGTFSNLAAGSYTITVKDANGCSTTQPVTITEPASALGSSISSQTNVACFGNSTGSVTVAGSGGTSPYTFSKDGVNFGNSGTFSNLAAGSYTITVKDANGCTTTQPVTITQPASGLTASALASNPACSTGAGSITVTSSGGTGALSYSIDGTNFQASNVFNGLASGSYTITVKDANGCTTTTGATVTIPTAVTASSTKADPLCDGQLGSMTATFSGGTPGYECSLDNGSFAPCTSPATFNNLGAGSHIVAVRDSNACLGPSQTRTIVIPTAINASITTTPASSGIAADGTMTVTVNRGTPGYSVTLNGGAPHTIAASGGSTTFTGLTSGGYNVVTTDANGCSLGIAEQLGVAPATTEVRLCTILSSLGTGGKTVFMVTFPKGPLQKPLTVFYPMSGTAVVGADYSLSPIVGRFTIPAGKTSATVTITALKNLARKTNRNATMTIINGPGYFATLQFNKSTVTIRR